MSIFQPRTGNVNELTEQTRNQTTCEAAKTRSNTSRDFQPWSTAINVACHMQRAPKNQSAKFSDPKTHLK